jgi:hypothetical protein
MGIGQGRWKGACSFIEAHFKTKSGYIHQGGEQAVFHYGCEKCRNYQYQTSSLIGEMYDLPDTRCE